MLAVIGIVLAWAFLPWPAATVATIILAFYL